MSNLLSIILLIIIAYTGAHINGKLTRIIDYNDAIYQELR